MIPQDTKQKSITAKICLAIANIVAEHEEELSYDDIVGNLLTTAAAFGLQKLGANKTAHQLAIQMAIICEGNKEAMDKAMQNAITAMHTLKHLPKLKSQSN